MHLQIVTPDRVSFIGEVEQVNVPSVDGMLGILPKHAHLFAQLTDGEVKITQKNDDLYLAIGGGFIEVGKDKVTLLVTRAVRADELNEEEILKARKSAEEALKKQVTAEERHTAQLIFRRSSIEYRLFRKLKNRPLRH